MIWSIAGVALGLSVYLVTYALFGGMVRRSMRMKPRVGLLETATPTNKGVKLSKFEEKLISTVPKEFQATTRKLQDAAGLSGTRNLAGGLRTKVLFGVLGAISGLVMPLDLPLRILVGGFAGFVLFFLPDLFWFQQGNERKVKVSQGLPDALDQLSLLVDSGMAFQPALDVVASKTAPPLKDDLTHTLNDLKIGTNRKDAFASLALRTRSESLRKFARAISLADTFGVSIAGVLRSQARELRIARRLSAEEKAQKVPTKVVFPLILCFLPVILGILVAPALIGLIGILDQT